MITNYNFFRLRTSWTKYDIVQVMEAVYSEEAIYRYKNGAVKINEAVLKSFLGIRNLSDPLPGYWIELQKYPKEKKLFALLAVIFTHSEVINEFAEKWSKGSMKGVFEIEPNKKYTNIRSALVESGASDPIYRRAGTVPYDFSPIFQNLEVGKLFKNVLLERIARISEKQLNDEEFYRICIKNNFHKTLSISENQFKAWLEGQITDVDAYVKTVEVKDFLTVENVNLTSIDGCKEVYFLGENGDGKTLLLMAIYLSFNRFFIANKTEKDITGKILDILGQSSSLHLAGMDTKRQAYSDKHTVYLKNMFAYGIHRGRYDTDNADKFGFMSLFDDNQTLRNPVTWLVKQKYIEIEDAKKEEVGGIKKAFSVTLLQEMFFELLERNISLNVGVEDVEFIEKGAPLRFDKLSEGYKSVIVFVSDLLSRLQENQPDVSKVEDLRGVVLLDEIDLHLHPKWQRSLVRKLRTLLPKVQFFFTTHSPTIIQGASEDAMIYRVYRNSEDGKTRVSEPYYRKDLDHLMINTVLTSPLFGMEDSRMDKDNDEADTSDTYLLYRIDNKLKERLSKQKAEGKELVSDKEIDDLIQKIIDEELNSK
jgi:predicted ATPase